MQKIQGVIKANFLYLKYILLVFIIIALVDFGVDFILGITGVASHTEVSAMNIYTSFIVAAAIAMPLFFYKKIMDLGASRWDYYLGTLISYLIISALFAVLNVSGLYVELYLLDSLRSYYNIITIFSWDHFGLIGMFVYQLSAYLLVLSFINFILSGIRQMVGIITAVLVAGITALFLSVGVLRVMIVKLLNLFLFNPNIIVGTILSLILTTLFFTLSWLFIRKRENF
ncbi:MAG: hypothetical protein ACLFUI_05765 [Halanaerobiales bacterium]